MGGLHEAGPGGGPVIVAGVVGRLRSRRSTLLARERSLPERMTRERRSLASRARKVSTVLRG